MALSESPAIEDLRLLLALAEIGNVTQVAKQFGVSQPSVTKHLKVFHEKQALQTTGGVVELTAKGQRLLPAIRDLVRQYDQIKAAFSADPRLPRVLSLATGSSASQYFLPAAIAALREQAPELEIAVQATRGSQRISGVLSGQFDLAIVSHDPVQIDLVQSAESRGQPPLVVEPLARQPICLVAARDLPVAEPLAATLAGQAVSLETLSQLPLIGLDRGSGIRRQLERAFANSPERLRFGPQAAGWLAAKEYARHGLGVALLPLGLLSREDGDSLVVRRLQSDISIHHYVIHRADSAHPQIPAMKAALQAAAEQHQENVQRLWRGVV